MKQIVAGICFVVWTLLCIYGTYDNTVRSASVTEVGNGYEITFGNTGEVHYYE